MIDTTVMLPHGNAGVRVRASDNRVAIMAWRKKRRRFVFWKKRWALVTLVETQYTIKKNDLLTLRQAGRDFIVTVNDEKILTYRGKR